MALVFKDRVQETTTTTGNGTLTLAGAVAGYQAFSVVGDGSLVAYTIADASNNWEVGQGTYTLSGTTLSRTTILASSNSGAAVSFAAGIKTVWLDLTASFISDLLLADAAKLAGNLDVNGNTITTSITNGSIEIAPNGAGSIALNSGGNVAAAIQLECTGAGITLGGDNIVVTANSQFDLSGVSVMPIGTTSFFDESGLWLGTPKFLIGVPIDLNTTNKIINVADPTAAQDAATKRYVDTAAKPSPLPYFFKGYT